MWPVVYDSIPVRHESMQLQSTRTTCTTVVSSFFMTHEPQGNGKTRLQPRLLMTFYGPKQSKNPQHWYGSTPPYGCMWLRLTVGRHVFLCIHVLNAQLIHHSLTSYLGGLTTNNIHHHTFSFQLQTHHPIWSSLYLQNIYSKHDIPLSIPSVIKESWAPEFTYLLFLQGCLSAVYFLLILPTQKTSKQTDDVKEHRW